MRKKLVFGCVLIFILLLLMPSIPAIQYKTIEESSFDDYFKNHFKIEIKDLEKNINNISWKFPVLWVVMLLLSYVAAFRLFRCYYLLTKSAYNWFNPYEGLKITNPILFLRGMWLLATIVGLTYLIVKIDEKMGWDNPK